MNVLDRLMPSARREFVARGATPARLETRLRAHVGAPIRNALRRLRAEGGKDWAGEVHEGHATLERVVPYRNQASLLVAELSWSASSGDTRIDVRMAPAATIRFVYGALALATVPMSWLVAVLPLVGESQRGGLDASSLWITPLVVLFLISATLVPVFGALHFFFAREVRKVEAFLTNTVGATRTP